MLRTLIFHINKSPNLLIYISDKKLFNEKTGNVTFFLAKIDLPICPNTYELFQIFSNFWKLGFSKNVPVVFANLFDRLSRNFLSIVRSLFAKTYPNCRLLTVFSKQKKSKIRKKSEKIHMYSDKFPNWFF